MVLLFPLSVGWSDSVQSQVPDYVGPPSASSEIPRWVVARRIGEAASRSPELMKLVHREFHDVDPRDGSASDPESSSDPASGRCDRNVLTTDGRGAGYSLETALAKSRIVVLGTVTDHKAGLLDGSIYTLYSMEITEVIKAPRDRSLDDQSSEKGATILFAYPAGRIVGPNGSRTCRVGQRHPLKPKKGQRVALFGDRVLPFDGEAFLQTKPRLISFELSGGAVSAPPGFAASPQLVEGWSQFELALLAAGNR